VIEGVIRQRCYRATPAKALRTRMTQPAPKERERIKNAAVLGLIELVLFLFGRALEPVYGVYVGAALMFFMNFLYVYYFGAHVNA